MWLPFSIQYERDVCSIVKCRINPRGISLKWASLWSKRASPVTAMTVQVFVFIMEARIDLPISPWASEKLWLRGAWQLVILWHRVLFLLSCHGPGGKVMICLKPYVLANRLYSLRPISIFHGISRRTMQVLVGFVKVLDWVFISGSN